MSTLNNSPCEKNMFAFLGNFILESYGFVSLGTQDMYCSCAQRIFIIIIIKEQF